MKRHAVLTILTILVAVTGYAGCRSTPATPTTSQELRVHFIDVGQGDSLLVDLGDTEVLIDAGEQSPGVVAYLRDFVDGKLEVMIASHPHADHIGGLIDVLKNFEVEQVWHNGETSDSRLYDEFMAAVKSENARVDIARRGDRIVAGAMTFTILNPVSLEGTTNNNSVVAHLIYGGVGFLFTGDAEVEAERAMLVAADMPVPQVKVLKLGHHGSRTASSPDFLAATRPEIAIYMAGIDNRYGHPHKETLAALSQIRAGVYGTDTSGTIVVATDGDRYNLSTEKR